MLSSKEREQHVQRRRGSTREHGASGTRAGLCLRVLGGPTHSHPTLGPMPLMREGLEQAGATKEGPGAAGPALWGPDVGSVLPPLLRGRGCTV